MPVLHMVTESVRGMGQQIQQMSDMLQQQRQQLTYSMHNLSNSWQGPSASIFIGEIQPMLQQLGYFADVGALLNQRLQREVNEWEQVDREFGMGNNLGLSDFRRFTDIGAILWRFGSQSDSANLGQAWMGNVESTDLFSSTNYHLIRGKQLERKSRYLQGEMTWAEMLQQLGKMEESLKPDRLDFDSTLYRFAKGQGEVGGAAWRNDWAGENWNVSLRANSAEARGNYDLRLSKQGLEGQLQGEVGWYAVRGQYNAKMAGVDVAIDGYIGAQAKGQLAAEFTPTAMMGAAGVSAFVGGRVDGSISKEASLAGVKGKAEGRGGVSYGVGFKAEAEFGYKDGVIKFDTDFGLTLGLGAELGFSIELDVTGAVDNVVEIGKDLVYWGAGGLTGI